MSQPPILWSFRRCPYAIRARLAIRAAGIRVELREIVLRNKPEKFLDTSPTATVPALRLADRVLDESLDIMIWALNQQELQNLLDMPKAGWGLIEDNDGPFKTALDHTKYAVRYPELDAEVERTMAASYLVGLNAQLQGQAWLFGGKPTLADLALLPFVRQFASINRVWFDAQAWPDLIVWLDRFTESQDFALVMPKFKPWVEGDAPLWFGV